MSKLIQGDWHRPAHWPYLSGATSAGVFGLEVPPLPLRLFVGDEQFTSQVTVGAPPYKCHL